MKLLGLGPKLRRAFFRYFPAISCRAGLRELDWEYRPKIRDAVAAADSSRAESLRYDVSILCRELEDTLASIRTKDLMREAADLDLLPLEQQPLILDESSPFGISYLSDDSQRILRRAIKAARKQLGKENREKWESWAKIVTPVIALLVGLVSATVGLLTVILKQ